MTYQPGCSELESSGHSNNIDDKMLFLNLLSENNTETTSAQCVCLVYVLFK